MLTAFQCLAFAVFFEAAGESLEGKFGVAEVIVNRVEDKVGEFRNQNTICDVVKQRTIKHGRKICHFSFYCDGNSDIPFPENKIDSQALRESAAVAYAMLDGHNPGLVNLALWYHRVDIGPVWNRGLCKERQIGDHVFWKQCEG